MNEELCRLSEAFDCGQLSRRQLLKAMGAAAVLAPVSALAIPAGLGGQTGQMSAPAPAPFEPTGWKTILLDHLSCKVADHEKEAAFYNALMNWPVRSDNAQESVLDIGDFGGIVIRGGYQASADEIAAQRAQYDRQSAAASKRGAPVAPFVPRNAVFDNFCWGIDQWNAHKVEAALKARGLNPVPDNHGHDFESFHVKDPDGFDVQISNGNRHNRRTTPARGHLSESAPFDHTDWKTIWLDHISFQCTDHKRTIAFYQALLGWEPQADTGTQNQVRISDIGDITLRNYPGKGHGNPGSGRGAFIDHISFGITPFNPAEMKVAFEKSGRPTNEATNGGGPIATARYKSYITRTPNGFELQISDVTLATRGIS